MKKRSRIIALLLVLATLFLFSSCVATKDTDSPAAGTTEKKESSVEGTVTDPPDVIDVFYQEANQNFPEGFSHKDNWLMQRICEMANVTLGEVIVPAYTDTATKFNIMMASGNIPDYVHRADVNAMKQYGQEGAFLPLENIIKESPVLSNMYNELQLETLKSADDVIYILRSLPAEDDITSNIIRHDLLVELGFDIPKTLDDYVEIFRAIKAKYPDSVPYSTRDVGLSGTGSFLFIPFNTNHSGWQWYPERNKVSNVFEGDNIVKAVEFAKALYDEGLFDREFVTLTAADWQDKQRTKQVFCFPNNRGTIGIFMQRYISAGYTDVMIAPAPFPVAEGVGIDEVYAAPPLIGGHSCAINAKTKKQDAVVRFINTLFSDEIVHDLSLYGREGIEYKVEDGQKIPIFPEAFEGSWISLYGWAYGNTKEKLAYAEAKYIYSTDQSDEFKKEYVKVLNEYTNIVHETMKGKLDYSPLNFTKPLPDEIINRASEAGELQRSIVTKAIVGEMSIEEFIEQKDKIVQKYEDVTKAHNDAVDEIRGKLGI